jgi:flagellar basal-body rod protein FlgF
MDRVLYLSMSGAKQTMLAQAASNNNLANANTTAFRADFSDFRAMPVYGPGHPTRVYAMTERPASDMRPGVVQTTGRDLDMAIQGAGWFAVQAADGREAYTRAGDLRIAAGGLLTNGAGQVMLGNGGPIVLPPADKVEIGVDGTISIVGVGQPATSLTVIDRIKLVNPDTRAMVKGADGLMRMKDDSLAEPSGDVRLATGALESSNVNVVEALVQQIALARQYELQVKMMRAAGEIDAASTQMMKMA